MCRGRAPRRTCRDCASLLSPGQIASRRLKQAGKKRFSGVSRPSRVPKGIACSLGVKVLQLQCFYLDFDDSNMGALEKKSFLKSPIGKNKIIDQSSIQFPIAPTCQRCAEANAARDSLDLSVALVYTKVSRHVTILSMLKVKYLSILRADTRTCQN